jgi:hypothetical protein
MFFLRDAASKKYLTDLGRDLDAAMSLDVNHVKAAGRIVAALEFSVDNSERVRRYVHAVCGILGSIRNSGRLLHISEYGIWPSSEDWSLYYSMRQINYNYNMLAIEPGHFFMAHEGDKFASFLSLALDFGWGGTIAGGGDDDSVVFNHDGRVMVLSYLPRNNAATILSQSNIPFLLIK